METETCCSKTKRGTQIMGTYNDVLVYDKHMKYLMDLLCHISYRV